MSNNQNGTYSRLLHPVPGDTGTGLDQLVDAVNTDPGLAGANSAVDIAAGAAAANSLNHIILEAAAAVGATADKVFTTQEVVAMNTWIRANRLQKWTDLHGDDENDEETGYHRVQNDGSNVNYRGDNLLNTVADGIYHMGFEIQNSRFLNEDGNENAQVSQVARWLTQFYTDHSTTGSGLDRITNLVMADAGLNNRIPDSEIAQGADYADKLNHLILDGLKATGALADNWVSTDDVVALNHWIRSDATRLAYFTELHGDDENNEETGYHLVQNDGANTTYFGQNLVNTVADGIYHIGFDIENGRLLNEDGNENAKLSDVSDWLNYFMADQSTTGTGLDYITDHIKVDTGLARNTSAADINEGASYADKLNHLVLDAAAATGAMNDGWFTYDDLVAMNNWVRSDATRYEYFCELHGDDEDDEETGYHLVQNDGANTNFFGDNLINGPADSIYHFGFQIRDGHFLNEDGNQNAEVWDVASWLNYFIKGNTLIAGLGNLTGTDAGDQIMAHNGTINVQAGAGNDLVNGSWGSDVLDGGAGDDQLYAGYGNDVLIGGQGDDILVGEGGDDRMDGGEGSDTYRFSGNGSSSFTGFDTIVDTGTSGIDCIVAVGTGDVDIGSAGFSAAATGIEVIDTTGVTGTTRLVGGWSWETLDLRGVTVLGNLTLDGSYGNDRLYGNDQDNTLIGGSGDDFVDGGNGSDTYKVYGNISTDFAGYDTIQDSGSTGVDRMVAIGSGNVDIGALNFSAAATGLEVLDVTAVGGTAQLFGGWGADSIDLRAITVLGGVVLNGYYGNDKLYGNAQDNTLIGGGGDDFLDGGNGSDTYRVYGNVNTDFAGFDTIQDTGASGVDRLVAIGNGNVDIGAANFVASTMGLEVLDVTGVTGTAQLFGSWGGDTLDLRGLTVLGDVVLNGYYGNDKLYGNAQDNTLIGGGGDDFLDGGNGSDTYKVYGNANSDFAGFDTIQDTGVSGVDRLVAIGNGNVDIGAANFVASTMGLEVLDVTGVTGTAQLFGSWGGDTLDLRGLTVLGDVVLNGYYGNDKLYGNAQDNTLIGGGGDDFLDGGNGSDTYKVYGNANSDFAGFDTIQDTGVSGVDRLVAIGNGNVDIGATNFNAAAMGLEVLDVTGVTGTAQLFGSWGGDTLDLRGITVLGNVTLNGFYGNDKLYGNDQDNILIGGGGDDFLDGGNGSDTYRIYGNVNSDFAGFDTIQDTGASGVDRLVAIGNGNVDIGATNFVASNMGLEVLDVTGVTGTAQLFGSWGGDTLDLRGLTVQGNVVLNGYYGNDTLYGNDQDNILIGGGGDDFLDGGNGSDTYRIYGNVNSDFAGFDTIRDTGGSGVDRLVAIGNGNVDIGATNFVASNMGLEVLDVTGVTGTAQLFGSWGGDTLDLRGLTVQGNVVLNGYYGNDTLYGNDQDNILIGGGGDDFLDGGDGSDTYRIYGNVNSDFAGLDTIRDSGGSGVDRLVAIGNGNVDIGAANFNAAAMGLEVLDVTGVTGTAQLFGSWGGDTLDLRGLTVQGNVALNGYYGNDRLYGNDQDNTLIGGGGNDFMDGGNGSDTYRIYGNAGSDFANYDTFADSGTTGVDRIQAIGSGNVDIGLRSFSLAGSGIEVIDVTGVGGAARILGDWSADVLDFKGVDIRGNLTVDAYYGNDQIYGNSQNTTLLGGGGDDVLVGGGGVDSLDGGEGNDLLLDGEVMIGGSGSDRLAIAQNDGAHIDLYGGGLTAAKDGSADLFSLVGKHGALNCSASIHGFEQGRDHVDLSQLLDAGNATLDLNDLVINYVGGNAEVDFKAGVHTADGSSVAVHLSIEGVSSLTAADFYFANASVPGGIPALDNALAHML